MFKIKKVNILCDYKIFIGMENNCIFKCEVGFWLVYLVFFKLSVDNWVRWIRVNKYYKI